MDSILHDIVKNSPKMRAHMQLSCLDSQIRLAQKLQSTIDPILVVRMNDAT